MRANILVRVQTFASALLLVSLAIGSSAVAARTTLTPAQAQQAVGTHATVCGVVASAHYAAGSRGQPTFLNLGKPYPNEIFTALIWGSDRSKFTKPPETLEGQTICVSGLIKLYHGTSEIIVSSPAQISSMNH